MELKLLKLAPLCRTGLSSLVAARSGEMKLGQSMAVLTESGSGTTIERAALRKRLEDLAAGGCRYALLGIPEDIGPRANFGRAGAADAWPAFLSIFSNMQDNRTLRGSLLACLGHVYTGDLGTGPEGALITPEALRPAVQILDERVEAIASEV